MKITRSQLRKIISESLLLEVAERRAAASVDGSGDGIYEAVEAAISDRKIEAGLEIEREKLERRPGRSGFLLTPTEELVERDSYINSCTKFLKKMEERGFPRVYITQQVSDRYEEPPRYQLCLDDPFDPSGKINLLDMSSSYNNSMVLDIKEPYLETHLGPLWPKVKEQVKENYFIQDVIKKNGYGKWQYRYAYDGGIFEPSHDIGGEMMRAHDKNKSLNPYKR